MGVILTAADRKYEIMHARCPPGSRIFSRFGIDILMNNDRKYTCDFERALHENMNYVSIDPDPSASLRSRLAASVFRRGQKHRFCMIRGESQTDQKMAGEADLAIMQPPYMQGPLRRWTFGPELRLVG